MTSNLWVWVFVYSIQQSLFCDYINIQGSKNCACDFVNCNIQFHGTCISFEMPGNEKVITLCTCIYWNLCKLCIIIWSGRDNSLKGLPTRSWIVLKFTGFALHWSLITTWVTQLYVMSHVESPGPCVQLIARAWIHVNTDSGKTQLRHKQNKRFVTSLQKFGWIEIGSYWTAIRSKAVGLIQVPFSKAEIPVTTKYFIKVYSDDRFTYAHCYWVP